MPIPRSRLLLRGLIACIVITSLSGCGGDSAGPQGRVVVTVVVSATRPNVAVGQTLQLDAIALDGNGFPVGGASYQWSSSNNAIATVSGTGLVTGVALGPVTITALTGTIAGSINITVGPVMTVDISREPTPRG